MFELTIKCSKDIKRLTLDFEDSTHSVAGFSEDFESSKRFDTTNKTVKPDNDFMNRLSNIKIATTNEPEKSTVHTPIPNVQNRPPLVDDGFNESL